MNVFLKFLTVYALTKMFVNGKKEAFLDLLDSSFPGMKANILRCEKLGFPWDSKPILKERKGEILSHVGLLDYPIAIQGRLYKIGALHAVCTKKTYRGQGFATDLIHEALNQAGSQYDFFVLYTEIPHFYERLSFEHLQEYRFHLPCKRSKGSRSLIPVASPQEDDLFKRCFLARVATSNVVWVKDLGFIAAFNALFSTYPAYWSLQYSPTLNGMISWEVKGKTLHLYDVIAGEMPSLDAILDHLPEDIEEVYFYFPPDLFTHAATPEPFLYDKGYFMVRGSCPRGTH